MATLYGLALIATGMMIGAHLFMKGVLGWRREGRILRFKIDGDQKQECVVISLFEYQMVERILNSILFDPNMSEEAYEDQSRQLSFAIIDYTNWIANRTPAADAD